VRTNAFLPSLLAVVLLAACNNSSTSTPAAPSTPPPSTVTESFSGVLPPQGSATYFFTVANTGSVTATLTTLSPDSTLVVGISLGIWNGTSCRLIIANDQATQGTFISGNLSAAGNLCVRIYDSRSNVAAPETFQLTANHP
jgi:hypothetical protein